MDPIQAEIYSTVLTAAPYVITAYVLMLVVLFVYVFYAHRSAKNVEKQLDALEEALARLQDNP